MAAGSASSTAPAAARLDALTSAPFGVGLVVIGAAFGIGKLAVGRFGEHGPSAGSRRQHSDGDDHRGRPDRRLHVLRVVHLHASAWRSSSFGQLGSQGVDRVRVDLSVDRWPWLACVWLRASALALAREADVPPTANVRTRRSRQLEPHDATPRTSSIGAVGVNKPPDEFKSRPGDLTRSWCFLLLFAILTQVRLGADRRGAGRARAHIAEHIAAAEKANDEAKMLLAEYEKKLAAAQEQVRAILEEARRDAEHTKQEIAGQGRQDAAGRTDRASARSKRPRIRRSRNWPSGAPIWRSTWPARSCGQSCSRRSRKLVHEAIGRLPSGDASRTSSRRIACHTSPYASEGELTSVMR